MSTWGYHGNKFIFHDSRKQVTAKNFGYAQQPIKRNYIVYNPLFDTYQELF